MVVAWHWIFTIILWESDGPHATNPLGFTSGLWMLTWLFQVMPLFFFVGGYASLRAYQSGRRRGRTMRAFVEGRLKTLAIPAIVLILVWAGIAILVTSLWHADWIDNAALLVVSPLWFLVTYLLLIALFPVFFWLHRRFGVLLVVTLAGAAGLVDVARFDHGYQWGGWFNMMLVWGLCFVLGFYYPTFLRWPRRELWALAWGGLLGLTVLVASDAYPGSMVGVPGEKVSNMAPPTLCIVALLFFQVGVAMLLRPWLSARLATPRWARVNEVINRFALPLYLFHTSGFAIAWGIGYLVNGQENEYSRPDLHWWLTRPLAFIGPLLFTLPIIYVFGRRWVKPTSEVHEVVT